MMSAPVFVACGALLVSAGGLFCTLSLGGACSSNGMPSLRAEAGSRPAGEVLFFASPKKSTQKKGDPAVCVPCASLRGNLRCSRAGCAAELAARLRRSAQTAAASQFTKRVCPAAHAPPRPLRSSAHPEGQGDPSIPTGLCFARPSLRSAWRLRPRDEAERRKGPNGCWLFGCSAIRLFGCPTPAGCACGGAVAG